MDRHQLAEALKAAGVPAAWYEIAGTGGEGTASGRNVPAGPAGMPAGPRATASLYLAEQQGAWVVGVEEHGRRRVLERFPDEDGACRHLHALLTDEGPPPSPLTPEETEELLHHGDRVQRRARERLARALDDAGRPHPGDGGPRPPDHGG